MPLEKTSSSPGWHDRGGFPKEVKARIETAL
jgi:hypothetical protein